MSAWANQGWLPQDDGVLAQSAVRVLHGELPHRDFTENYTGGLSLLNAAGMRLFGINLVSLRLILFLFFLAWVPALFYVASRTASPLAAAGITVAAVAWSVPNYPAPMPSWYNLFFAVFGAAAVLRYLETGRRRWLFVAGLCGGLSFDAKITGLYYVAAVLLFLVYREQESAEEAGTAGHHRSAFARLEPGASGPPPARAGESRFPCGYSIFVIAALTAFLGALVVLIGRRLDLPDIIHFLVPALALAVVLFAREARHRAADSRRRFHTLFRMAVPFAGGFLLPVIALLAPYALSASRSSHPAWRQGSSGLAAFFHGVFSAGMARAAGIAAMPPGGAELLYLPAAALLAIALAAFWRRAAGLVPAAIAAAVLAGGLFFVTRPGDLLRVWYSVSLMTPLAVAAGAGILLARPVFAGGFSPIRRQQLMLLLALAAMCGMVQFPFAAPVYFCYFAPLLGLALLALVNVRRPPANRWILASLLCFYVVFAAVRIAPRSIYSNWGLQPAPPPRQAFHLPRAAGITGAYAGNYEAAARLAREHSPNGLLLATPECPDMYFLSGLQNPTANDLDLPLDELAEAIERPDVNVVVINLQPVFSPDLPSAALAQKLVRLFPHSQRIGRYWIGWRK
jgi:Ca2+/Na+ antiporter